MNFTGMSTTFEPLPQRKRRRKRSASPPQTTATTSHQSKSTKPNKTKLNKPKVPSNFQEIEGDLLQLRNINSPLFIVHQTNCVSQSARGLAKHVFAQHPYADTYKKKKKKKEKIAYIRTAGTCSFHKGPTLTVVNLYGQHGPGKNYNRKKYPHIIDDKKARVNFFKSAIEDLRSKLTLSKEEEKTVAFPFGIGCNLAGGDWTVYYAMLQQFAARNPHLTILLVRLPDHKMNTFNQQTGTKGSFEKTAKSSSSSSSSAVTQGKGTGTGSGQRKINTMFLKSTSSHSNPAAAAAAAVQPQRSKKNNTSSKSSSSSSSSSKVSEPL